MSFPPIALLADSQLLFHHPPDGAPFLVQLAEMVTTPIRRAAYLGASNGDQPEFYDLFVSAMGPLALDESRHVRDDASSEDLAFLDSADLLLLAGGDVQRGLRSFERSGVAQKILDAYLRGALLIGVSAGAVQLGSAGHVPPGPVSNGVKSEDGQDRKPGFRVAPFIVDVHAGPEWKALRRAVALQGEGARGIGIVSGAGAILHRDGTLEPVRKALVELVARDDGSVSESLLVAPE